MRRRDGRATRPGGSAAWSYHSSACWSRGSRSATSSRSTLAEYSFYDADRFYVDPATVPPEQAAQRAANMATMRVFAGDPYMHDPGLPGRLGRVEIPVLVLWGDSDRIVTPGYGQALAAAFPQAQFTVISQAGHLPQLEQPDATFGALDAFIRKDPGPGRPAA